jgi:large subunit ribosomal protein L11
MRKVSLEMNLGKKSMARFPRRVQSNLKLKLIANASEAEPLPPLGPALTLFGVNARGFCEDFNHNSKDYDTGFPVSINLWVTATKSYYYEFRSPSCFNLFNRCFDFIEGSELPQQKKLLLLAGLNISLIKNVDNKNFFFKNLRFFVKQVLGSLRSYGFSFRKKKFFYPKFYVPSFRRNQQILNTKFSTKKK